MRPWPWPWPWIGACAGAALCACGGPQRALSPAGPGAAALLDLATLFVVATVLPAAVVIGIIAYLLLRRAASPPGQPGRQEDAIILWIGGGLTAALILALLLSSLRAGTRASAPPGEAALTVEVIGHQFWWEVRYPDHSIVTANEIHVPAGAPVHLRLSSADVIHSFWVPELHGKVDMIPGRVHHLVVRADRPGAYRGQCAEFCGIQHALMALWVIADEGDAFASWLGAMQRQPEPPAGDLARRGQQVFMQAHCHTCHAVRGSFPEGATGAVGPDLTHLARRRMIGAATLPLNRDVLRRWIHDPDRYKPGIRMPASPLSEADMDALIAYLETLR